ncbi:MAG TPA: response regulator transcription factor [Candidatus Acidoferrales bacterium]|nr:response regulator transcription factor [Candidatus Acidoferrales bacterium]
MAARLLVVDDEPATARVTAELLRRAGYEVDVAHGGVEALQRVHSGAPDLMVLDYDMPDLEGPEVLEQLRRPSGRVPFPVVILTGARAGTAEQVLGLERGASDYVLKGGDRQLLLARIRRALRDHLEPPTEVVRGALRLDVTAWQAWLGDRRLRLERKPFQVLLELASQEGRVFSRAELLRRIWRTDYAGFDHAVEQAVYSARKELGRASWIETVARHGYRFRTQR